MGSGWTSLMHAAYSGHLSVVRSLLEGGAKIEASSTDGRTAMVSAAFNGHLEIVNCLLEHGASISEARGRERATPCSWRPSMGTWRSCAACSRPTQCRRHGRQR